MKRIILLDASALKVSSCGLRLKLTVIDGIRSKLNANDMEFGSAFHLCAKRVGIDGNIGIGIQDAREYWQKTPMIIKEKKQYMDEHYLVSTCMNWFANQRNDNFDYLKDNNGRSVVEVRFKLPFWRTEQTEVLLCGTIDKVCVHRQSKILAIGDYKTTSMLDIKSYFESYKLSCQLYFYVLALKKLIAQSIKNNDTSSPLLPFAHKDLFAFVDGIFCRGKDKPVEFARSDVMPVGDDKLIPFESMLEGLVSSFVTKLESGTEFLPDGILNDSCETKYGKCKFFSYCAAPDASAKKHVLNNNFIAVPYNPSTFGELATTE